MNQESIRLKDAFFGACLKWRKILIAGLAVAVVVGGFDFISQLKNRSSSMEAYNEALTVYYEKVEESEKQVEFLTKEVEEQEAKLENLRDYNEKSVLLKIDPKQKAIASADYLIEMKDLKMIEGTTGLLYDPTDAAVLDYAYNVMTYVDWAELARVSKEDQKYLYETVEIYRNMDANVLTIYVVFYDADTALEMLKVVEDAVEKVHENSTTTVGEHTIKLINEGTRITNDATLEKSQADHIQSEKDCETDLEERRNELENIKPVKEPVMQFRYRNILMHSAIFSILGLIVGAGAALYLLMLHYTTDGKIHSGKELERIGKTRVLAAAEPTMDEKKKQNKIDRYFLTKAGIQKGQDSEQMVRMAALKLETLVKKGGKVLLTGHVAKEQLEDLKKCIEKYTSEVILVSGADLEKDPDTYDAMRKADGLVAVEQSNTSTYEQLASLGKLAEEAEIPVVGCILL